MHCLRWVTLFAVVFTLSVAPAYANPVRIDLPEELNAVINVDSDISSGKNVSVRIDPNAADSVRTGEDMTIESGEIRDGDVVVLGGSATIDGVVKGDLVVFGGNVSLSGIIRGDAVVFGGNIHLSDTAKIEGHLVSFGGHISREKGAEIQDGDIDVSVVPFIPSIAQFLTSNSHKVHVESDTGDSHSMLLFHGIAILWWFSILIIVLLLMGRNAEQAAKTMQSDALRSIVTGFLFLASALILFVFFILTVIGIPLSLVVVLFWIAVSMFAVPTGFIALGASLLRLFRRDASSVVKSGIIGFAVLSLVRFLPFLVGMLVWHLWAMTAMGAVITSKFGTMKPWFSRRNTYPPYPGNGIKKPDVSGGAVDIYPSGTGAQQEQKPSDMPESQ